MKRENISSLTPEQAADELVFMEFEKLLKAAKRKASAAQAAESAVFAALDDMCIDAEATPPGVKKNRNLKQVIYYFLSHGECTIADIMREVREAYGAQEQQS